MKEFNIRIFYPTTEQGMKDLHSKIAKAHIEAVKNCINGLSCPTEQKLKLIDSIIEKSTKS